MSDCTAGTIASVIAINEAGDRGDIWAHTEYSSSGLTLHGCNTVLNAMVLHFMDAIRMV